MAAVTHDERPAPRQHSRSKTHGLYVALTIVRVGPLLSLVALCVAMSIASPYFLTVLNFRNLGEQSAIVAVLGIGELMTILTAGVDLSVGSVVALSGISGVMVANSAPSLDNAAVVILVALLVGGAVGLVNGAAFVYGRMPHPFIVTLASLGVVSGIALIISGGAPRTHIPHYVLYLGNGLLFGIPLPVIVTLGVALVGSYFLRTQWGRWIYAVGANRGGAERVGIPTRKVLLSVYVFSGLCAGVAGLLATGLTATASPIAGDGYELTGITAVIIGGASFFGGRGSVGNVLVGALIFTIISNGLNLLGVSSYWQYIASGTVVALAVELDVLRRALEERFRGLQALGQHP